MEWSGFAVFYLQLIAFPVKSPTDSAEEAELEEFNFNRGDFENRNFTRLKYLQHLMKSDHPDASPEWRIPDDCAEASASP